MSDTRLAKIVLGKYRYPVVVNKIKNRLELNFSYNKELIEEVKVMEGARYHGYIEGDERKIWSIEDSQHNRFQLDFLEGKDPYAWYDRPLLEYKSDIPETRDHQIEMIRNIITYHYIIVAGEMGVGKTLAGIKAIEYAGYHDCFWVGPKSALAAVALELRRWKAKIKPHLLTYEALKKLLEEWKPGNEPPRFVVFDESSRCKNPTAQRTKAAQHLADAIRDYHGENGYVVEMSGSPAPKSPLDWYSQCKIARPGFLREGRYDKFRNRLALIKNQENSVTGGMYPSIVTWWDNEDKCAECGKLQKDHPTDLEAIFDPNQRHLFRKSKNEVSFLYQRMKGLVLVKFKKDCLQLPDKQYRKIFCPPTTEVLNAMKLITATGGAAIQVLTNLRELSDGFQYRKVKTGVDPCPACNETGVSKDKVYTGPEYNKEILDSLGVDNSAQHPENVDHPEYWTETVVPCPYCKGTRTVDHFDREIEMVTCPKEDALINLLDEHEEAGRLVVYGGFTGSIDRCVQIANKVGWKYIRVDGRGWNANLPGSKPEDFLEIFQSGQADHSRVLFIGQPGAAGMGLTLTASPSIVYYSNDFNAESRIQSEDRIHRLGMDVNRGATIIDLIHLPSDLLILDNLQKKRDLQSLTMGELSSAIRLAENEIRKY